VQYRTLGIFKIKKYLELVEAISKIRLKVIIPSQSDGFAKGPKDSLGGSRWDEEPSHIYL